MTDNKKKAKECWKNACYRHWWSSEYGLLFWGKNPYSKCPHCVVDSSGVCDDTCSVRDACQEYFELSDLGFFDAELPDYLDFHSACAQFCYEKWKGWR